MAQEYYPLTKEEVKNMPRFDEWKNSPQPHSTEGQGWNWYDEDVKTYDGDIYQPLAIDQYDERVVGADIAKQNIDACLGGTFVCSVSGKPFKIIKQELAFYIENGIPLPDKHHDTRHLERMRKRNPRQLFERTCDKCGVDIQTTYAPDRPERIYCEECYREEVYG